MAFHKCRNNGCEIQIEVRNTAEGWRPYEESGNMHQCQHSEYAKKQRAQEKNDHGNENNNGMTATSALNEQKIKETVPPKTEYVDHTAKGLQQYKAFSAPTTEILTEQGNGWIKDNQERIQVKLIGQLQCNPKNGEYAITVYYEEKQ